MVAPNCKLTDPLRDFDPFRDSVDQVLINRRITVRLFFHLWPEVSAHDKCCSIGSNESAYSRVGFDIDNLRVKQCQNNAWVFHDRSPFIFAFFQLLKANVFEIYAPIGVQLFLPLLEQSLKHQRLVISNFSIIVRINLGELSISNVSITLLGLLLWLKIFIILREILLQINTLLKPQIASPTHGNLIEILKKGEKSDEISVLEQLLFDKVNWHFDILKVIPLKQSQLLLGQSFFLGFSFGTGPHHST